jgi:trans-aconitate methyltransferase
MAIPRIALGARFAAARMADNYLFRPAYSPEVYETLLSLFDDHPRALLDAGCGPGKITLGLVDHLDRVDSVDPSEEMLRVAQSMPKAGDPKIRWVRSKIEDAELHPPYGLIVAGASIHWMDLDRTLARFGDALAPGAFLAVLEGDAPVIPPWEHDEKAFMIDFVERISGRRPDWWKTMSEGLREPVLVDSRFHSAGYRITAPVEVTQSIEDYLRCQHSRATWSEDHLGDESTREFDRELSSLLTRQATNGVLTYHVQTRIEWGTVG